MKNNSRFIILFLLASFAIIACKPDNNQRPASINNLPTGIIVKEKSISGNFDSLVYDIHLYASSDSIYFDSIYVENSAFSGAFTFNRSRFATQRFIYTDNPFLTPLGGDTTAVLAALFDNNNRISTVSTGYIINQNTPTYASSNIADFGYDINNRVNSFGFNNQNGNDFCHTKATGSSGTFYTNSGGRDSLVIITNEASCGACWNCSDFIFVTYLSKANNTNELFLSYPTIPSLTGYPSYFNLFFLEYIPFPKMNGKLIDKVSYMRQNGFTYTYTNSYTYDSEGRVKTAKIYYVEKEKEQLIEFNY